MLEYVLVCMTKQHVTFRTKLYNNLQPKRKKPVMTSTGGYDKLYEAMGLGCTGPWCTPKHAMLYGVQQLAGTRGVRLGREDSDGSAPTRKLNAVHNSPPVEWSHSPGTVRAMEPGWETPLHVDNFHSFAWNYMRRYFCNGERVRTALGTSPDEVLRYHVFTNASFTASAILTLHSPNRVTDPFDTNIYRVRWPALLHNCSIRTKDSYGVGVRFHREGVPSSFLERPLRMSPKAGDLFIFNGEFLHDTPRIFQGLRTVLNSFVGMSEHSKEVVVFA